MDHLLLHCEKMRLLWELLLSLFGISWVNSSSVWDTLLSSNVFLVSKKRQKVRQAGASCLFWSICKARDEIGFRDEMFPI